MPFKNAKNGNASVTRDAVKTEIVTVNNTAVTYANPLNVVQRTGMEPSTFSFEVGVIDDETDEVSDVLLQQDGVHGERSFPYFSKIVVNESGNTLFRGWLVKRGDDSRSAKVTFDAQCDKLLLNTWPINGCLVKDPYDDTVRFVERYSPVCNPGGYRNCVLAEIPGMEGQVPVFTWIGEYDTNGIGVGVTVESFSSDGGAILWTPERWIQYVRAYMMFAYPDYFSYMLRLTADSPIEFPPVSFGGEGTPGMRSKLPEMDFTGQSVLFSIVKVLEFCGEVGFHLEYNEEQSVISFHPMNENAANAGNDAGEEDANDLYLQRAGEVEDLRSAYAFNTESDASGLVASVVIQGATPWCEASWEYDGKVPATSSSVLVPGWTTQEATEFVAITKGDGTYASVLSVAGNWGGARAVMDGTGSKPKILAKTMQAIHLARQTLSKPFRAFKLASDTSSPGYATLQTALKGADSRYSAFVDAELNLSAPRPIGPEQLQPAFEIGGEARGRLRYPIRIEIWDSDAQRYHDVTQNSGIRQTSDGLIWLDGLTDEAPTDSRIYSRSFQVDPDVVEMKKIRINAFVPHDVRVSKVTQLFQAVGASATDAAVDFNGIRDIVDAGIQDKGLRFYALNTDDFTEEHQVGSRPAANLSWPILTGAGGNTPAPLTRVLYDQQDDCLKHSNRRAKQLMAIDRRGTWEFPGIRADLFAGRFVRDILFQGVGGRWYIKRPIRSSRYDFQSQRTEIRCE
jgi:hypothetical protein